MFKTFLSFVVTVIRLLATVACLVVIGTLTMFFKYYANSGETTTAFCCLFTSLCALGIIYFIWNKRN